MRLHFADESGIVGFGVGANQKREAPFVIVL
jgi:hypothetical protein